MRSTNPAPTNIGGFAAETNEVAVPLLPASPAGRSGPGLAERLGL